MSRIALDAMGGDHGVAAVVEGAARFSLRPGPSLLLVGHRDTIATSLGQFSHDPARIEIAHCTQVVPMAGDAKRCLDAMPDASVAVAARLVASGEADALVSAGHTAATVLASGRFLPRLPGVRRAALAAVYPTRESHGPHEDPFALMLDVGATLHASAEELVSFAVMGSAYARIVSDNPKPTVALLSNGSEANRGTPEIVEAHQRLLKIPAVNFVGNVEGLDVAAGKVDVVVCNGFMGNVVLKMLEGFFEVATSLAREASDRNLLWKVGLFMLQDGIQQIRSVTDWRQYGGAPLLGLGKVVIKAHGRSNGRAIRNALKVAAKAVDGRLVEQIQRSLPESPPVYDPSQPG